MQWSHTDLGISTSTGRVPSMAAVTIEPGLPSGRSAKKKADGLGTSIKPAPCISKTPISLGGKSAFCAPAIYDRYHDVYLKIQDRINHMLKHFGTRNITIFGHVTDNKCGQSLTFSQMHDASRNFADLSDSSRSTFQRAHKQFGRNPRSKPAV